MSIDVLIVLRGRPGLGHVIPGLAISNALEEIGVSTAVVTYSRGAIYLRKNKGTYRYQKYYEIGPKGSYRDWPGYTVYDNGLRELMPLIQREKPKFCILGGEYILPPLLDSIELPYAILFNPEITYDLKRNEDTNQLFSYMFSKCTLPIPLVAFNKKCTINRYFTHIVDKIKITGPFQLPITHIEQDSMTILIANGGGIELPDNSDSYSQDGDLSNSWKEYTALMTEYSLEFCVKYFSNYKTIYLFSGVSDNHNQKLFKKYPYSNIKISGISPEYYDALSKASLIISRIGCGFKTDCETTFSHVITWSLPGHEEQFILADEMAKTRKNTFHVESIEQLQKNIKQLALTKNLKNSSKTTFRRPYENAQDVAKIISQYVR